MISPPVQGFLTAAERDIAGIERLLPNLPDSAAFHAQQAVEKLAHAVCLHEGLQTIHTPIIARIAERLPEHHPFRGSLLALNHLSAATTIWHYLSGSIADLTPPDSLDIQALLDRIKNLQTEIHDWLSAR